ncbi:hypothetical protein MTR67_030901 [Solanum verrucosum]|uniref:DUF4283 domain-containing protein n=1 Tax=Solanum verrucosum TaxID=315347 RepID=A0AAF0ZCV8_SOLVR|nr:hypothetical protein MTR67_030901 [Solanum verrucosum]
METLYADGNVRTTLLSFRLGTITNLVAIDHVVRGDWFWKSYKFSLQWWSPTSNPIFERPNQVWIRVVGLPLHLWSRKVFREIRNLCGGWIRTKEETKLRNHLKWVRLKVQGDGESILSTVELTYEDLTFKVQIWVETLARVISDKWRQIPINTQRSEEVSSQKGEDNLLGFTEVTGHVGSSLQARIKNSPGSLPVSMLLTIEKKEKKSGGRGGHKNSEEDNLMLQKEFDDQELWESVKICAGDKAPGTNGAKELIDFSLIGSVYKIISKLLTERLKKNQKQAPRILCKLDIQKAYDHLNWQFLWETLDKRGLPYRLLLCLKRLKARTLGRRIGDLPTTYLGMPLGANNRSLALIANKQVGGQGVRNLKTQNQCLLMKWLWRLASNEQALWKEVIQAKYEMEDHWSTSMVTNTYGLGRTIRYLWPKLRGNCKIKIGNGVKVSFWEDSWL